MTKFWTIAVWCLSIFPLKAQPLSQKIDAVTQRTIEAFDVPGIAVAVVKDGSVIHAKGYGVRSINRPEKVDTATNFGIASNSKAFTSAALAILVDQNKIQWDDKVQKYIPEFKMYDTYVSEAFTIRDLLTHRSGLGLGAGDLMIWPDGHNFTPQDVIDHIQYLKPVSDFRSKYDYDNLLYILAGVIVERVSGLSWAAYVEKEIMEPIGMTTSAGNWNRLKDKTNVIEPHVPMEGQLQTIERYTNTILDAAAGIYSNVDDLSKWVLLQLQQGEWQGQSIFSKQTHAEMWTPQTLLPNKTTPPYNTLFKAYGLGWQLNDVAGKLQVSHTGGLEGIVTQITLLPQLHLGIIVLTNQQAGYAFHAITNTIKNHFLDLPPTDFVSEYSKNMQSQTDHATKITDAVWQTSSSKTKQAQKQLDKLIGCYEDPWFGTVKIYKKKTQYIFESERSPQLTGEILYYKDTIFAIKWFNRYFDADAFLIVEEASELMNHFTMEAISPLTDFSYDFQDLAFKRIESNSK